MGDNPQLIASPSLICADPYEVFLSFHGKDTRNNFTSHLYEALSQNKVRTFIDNKELRVGDKISASLTRAIQESDASIIIFSENYASSPWCLDELVQILDCKKTHEQVVIPVFYKVEPSHVRHQNGSYKHAFEKHEQNERDKKDKVLIWRAAPNEAAGLSGWTWNSDSDRTEAEFIKNIAGDVLKKLNSRNPIPEVLPSLNCLNISNCASMEIIHDMVDLSNVKSLPTNIKKNILPKFHNMVDLISRTSVKSLPTNIKKVKELVTVGSKKLGHKKIRYKPVELGTMEVSTDNKRFVAT